MNRFQLYIILISGLLQCSFYQNENEPGRKDQHWIEHKIVLSDPGHINEAPRYYNLYEQKKQDGLPFEYFLDVPSVYCMENICKVVPVRIFWNLYGDFKKLELDKPYKLEKDKGNHFSKKDYQKLELILKDKTSAFKTISMQEITKASSSEGVDAVSGATTIDLEEKATIRGATLTCYTLWQWANGEVVAKIRDLSGDQLKTSDFVSLLKSNDQAKVVFALEQLVRRELHDNEVNEAFMTVTTSRNDHYNKLARKYLEQVPGELFFKLVYDCYGHASSKMRIEILQAMLASNYKNDVGYYSSLIEFLKQSVSYQEMDLFLRLLRKNKINNQNILAQLLPFLEYDILISRRVYWYLSNFELPDKIKHKLEVFKQKNKDYL